MPLYTAAYSEFLDRMPEVTELRAIASQLKIDGTPEGQRNARRSNALCRAGVVLLSSHIEGYIEDLASMILGKVAANGLLKNALSQGFLYYFSRDLLNSVSQMDDAEKIAEKIKELFRRDSHIWSDAPAFSAPLDADKFVHGFANPTFEKIRRFIGRFGYTTYRHDLGHILRANITPCINMVDQVIDQRNKIAHGDAVVTGTPADLKSMIDLVMLFCRGTDRAVANWFTNKGCSIRK